jgi:hypothetical protein
MDTLLIDLVAFYDEHRDCATDKAGGVDEQANRLACVVWFACERCGVIIRQA